MSVAFSIDIRRLIVAPGVRETIYGVGNTFSVLTADVAGNPDPDFRIGLSDQSPVRFGRGLRYRMPDGETFDRLTIENPVGAAASLDISLMIALGDVSNERSQIVGTITANIGSMPAVQIAAGQSVAIAGTPAVSISGTPAVSISGTPTVAVSTMPAVTVAAGQAIQVSDLVSPASFYSSADVVIGTSPSAVIGGGATVRALAIRNIGWQTVRLGNYLTSVGAALGLPVRPGEMATIITRDAIYGCTASGTTKLALTRLMQ